MNRAPSAETTATPAGWLKAQKPATGRWISVTASLAFANGLLLIIQLWLVAKVISAVVFEDGGLGETAGWLWTIIALVGLRAVLSWVTEQAAFRAAARVKLQTRDMLYRHLFSLGPARLALERTGELTTAVTDGIEALESYYSRYLPAMVQMALLPLAILIVVFPIDWLSGLIMVLTAPLIPLFMILIGKGAERLNQKQWRNLARLSAHFLDVIQGLTTLKLFNASRREIGNIARISDDYRQSTMAVLRVAFLSSLALEFFATVSIAVVAVSIGFRLLWGEMAFLPGFFILLLAPEFYLPLRSMGTHYHARMEAIGAAERLVHILELEPLSRSGSSQSLPVPDLLRSPIAYRDVEVVFPGGNRALDGIGFDIRPGERLAIVGPSGAGKSTLANLLLGFVEPTAGRLLVGETPLESIDLDAWRKALGWIPQRPHLYAASVADNIRLARPDASDDEVRDAAQRAHAAEFIEQLPEGYATPIGEGGTGLSGGQAQRIALARAFLRDASLLILDEPTANLDADSERFVQAALDELANDRTLVVLAHRLDTIKNADRILLIEEGRLAAEGTHDEMLGKSERYRLLVRDFGVTG